MKCTKCGNDEEFWVLEKIVSWVKINVKNETINEDEGGDVEENTYDQTRYQCAECEEIIEKKWDHWPA